MNKSVFYGFTLLIFIIGFPAQVFPQWQRIDLSTNATFNKVVFTDPQNGWIFGDNGLIFHTNDGGVNWQQQNTANTFNIVAAQFITAQTGWALSWKNDQPPFGTLILRTDNGGTTWQSDLFPTENAILYDIFFRDTQSGWVSGKNGLIAYTLDGGNRWNTAQLDTANLQYFPVRALTFWDDQYGFACGGKVDNAGGVWKTVDGGRNWLVTPLGPEPLNDIQFIDSLNIIAVGGDFEYGASVARSGDGGLSWTYETLLGINARGFITSMDFRTESEIWATVGSTDRLLTSSDSGKTWQSFVTPDNVNFRDIVFVDSVTAFAVGVSGAVYRYQHQQVGIAAGEPTVIRSAALHPNYPNPFNPATTIPVVLNEPMQIELTIWNSRGQLVQMLYSGIKPGGIHHFRFSADNLPSGIYFYRLQATSTVNPKRALYATRQMILAK